MSSDWLPVLHSRIDSPLVNSLSLPNSRRSHPNSPRHTRVASIHPRAGCRTTPQVPGANCRSIAPACALPAQAPAAVLSRRVGGLWPPPRSLCPSLYALPPGGPGRPLGRWPIRWLNLGSLERAPSHLSELRVALVSSESLHPTHFEWAPSRLSELQVTWVSSESLCDDAPPPSAPRQPRGRRRTAAGGAKRPSRGRPEPGPAGHCGLQVVGPRQTAAMAPHPQLEHSLLGYYY